MISTYAKLFKKYYGSLKAQAKGETQDCNSALFQFEGVEQLKHFFAFDQAYRLIEDDLDHVQGLEDINQRRVLDAQVLSLIAANVKPAQFLDVGTHHGRSAARMASNNPKAKVITVNIHPDDESDAGTHITERLALADIGRFYRAHGLKNVHQVFANTRHWKPGKMLDSLQMAYIDGCHDTDFVYLDSILAIERLQPGGFLLWHDFNPDLRNKFVWINDVMLAVERLLAEKKIQTPLFHVKHSWIGIWQKP